MVSKDEHMSNSKTLYMVDEVTKDHIILVGAEKGEMTMLFPQAPYGFSPNIQARCRKMGVVYVKTDLKGYAYVISNGLKKRRVVLVEEKTDGTKRKNKR